MIAIRPWLVSLLIMALAAPRIFAGEARSTSSEWDKTVEAAKKEGKLVAAIPASAELRKAIGEIFPKRYPGIELDLTNARGPSNAGKIAAEFNAGVRYYDLLISGTSTPFNLLNAGILEPAEPLLILPEVKDPKRWFGGHVWLDNAKKYIYAFQVYQSENIWHNASMMKPEEARSYDDLLLAKFKGKIGILDPRRVPAPARRLGPFSSKLKAKNVCANSRRRKCFCRAISASSPTAWPRARSRHHRPHLLHVFTVLEGRTASQTAARHERRHYTSCGSSATSIVKNSPHPNATKVSSTGCSAKKARRSTARRWAKATRRLDVDTKWMAVHGVRASKDFLTVEENNRLENYGEETVGNYWAASTKIAEDVFK